MAGTEKTSQGLELGSAFDAFAANWPEPESRAASVGTLVPVTNSVTVDHRQEYAGAAIITDLLKSMNVTGCKLGGLSQNRIAPTA